jgi:hypothetical protein
LLTAAFILYPIYPQKKQNVPGISILKATDQPPARVGSSSQVRSHRPPLIFIHHYATPYHKYFQFDSLLLCSQIKSPLGKFDSCIDTTRKERLKTRTMDDLHVDDELLAIIIDDQGADAATARLEGLSEAGPEVGLVQDREGLLDVASLGHRDN